MQRSEPLAWDDVRLFLALHRSRTVGAAGRVLGVDGSTVSRRLTALEAALGATLFERGRDGVRATAAADELLPAAEEIEGAFVRFAGTAAGFDRVGTGIVRIACPPDVAEVFVVPLLRELRRRHPGVRLDIDPGEALADLTRRDADLALRTVRPTSGELVVTRIATARWVLAEPARRARAKPLRDWGAIDWIGWGERRAGMPAARWLTTHAPAVEPVVRTDSLSLQLALVRSGIGAALFPEPSLVHYGLRAVALAPRLQEAARAWPRDELYLVAPRALARVPRVRAVWDLLVSAR
jgi:DNA-binding transcriptional LysR family regulator